LNGSGAVHARHKSVRRRCPSVLPSLRRWLAPSFTHPSIDPLAILLHARTACPDCYCLVKSASHPRRLAARALANNQQSRSISLIPAHPHAPRRRIPLFTSSITAATFSTPNVANLPSILDSCARRSLSFHASIVYPTIPAVVAHLTAASPVASVASVLLTPSSVKSGAC
jgi:hypothetical protein